MMVFLFVFFFFQAEDGIRDVAVTGVQTCALPIYPEPRPECRSGVQDPTAEVARPECADSVLLGDMHSHYAQEIGIKDHADRSEERRVGKECRSRWSAEHEIKKENKDEIVGN